MTILSPPPAATHTGGGDPLLAVACPACHAVLAAASAEAGTAARCPVCRVAFLLPVPPRRGASSRDRGIDDPGAADGADRLHRGRERRSYRRARRNLLMLVSGAAILLAIVLLLGARQPRRHR